MVTVTISGLTITGGAVSCNGLCGVGGLFNEGTPMTITNGTVSANTVTCSGIGCTAVGGGLHNNGIMMLQKTIVAKQLAGPDRVNTGTLTSSGCNLDSDITCQLTPPSDKPNVTSPLLGPLQDNGGLTQTHALLPGSPAIDGGDPAGCTDNLGAPLTTDPRGFARPQDGHGDGRAICDLGAYDRCNGIFETRSS